MRTSFAIDDITIHRLVEQDTPASPMLEFLPALTRERLEPNRSWLVDTNAMDPATERALLCFQAFVIKTPHHNVLVDTCIGNHKERPTRASWHQKTDPHFMAALAEAKLGPEDIDFVMCTHLHADHVGWNTKLENGHWVPTFPKARYLFSQIEYDYWVARHAATPVPAVVDSVLPVVAARQVDFVKSDHVVNDHFRLLPSPGHTPDHFCVAVGKGRDSAVFIGDMAHSPLQARYPDLAASIDTDPVESSRSRQRIFERYADTPTLFCTAHFPQPSAGHLKRWDDGFRMDYAK